MAWQALCHATLGIAFDKRLEFGYTYRFNNFFHVNSFIQLSRSEARRFLVRYHGLDGAEGWRGSAGILAFLQRVGAIQYDPLDVVGRNPDLVLQSRIADYRRNEIADLLYRGRTLVDNWDKQMSIHLAAEWPHRARLRDAHAEAVRSWLQWRNSGAALEHLDGVHAKLAACGPALPAKLGFGAVANNSGWGSRNAAGAALEYLSAQGRVGVHARRNTQKIYDLIERLLPAELLNAPDPFAGEHDFLLWYAARRVEAVGLATNRNGGTWLVHLLDTTQRRAPLLEELVDRGRLCRVAVEGSNTPFYMPAVAAPLLNAPEVQAPAVRFLAPLDNLLFDRKLVEHIFDFKYGWEVYVPEAKRQYGYYVLPVLYGDQLVARFDPLPHRGNAKFEIKNWWWEPGVRQTPQLRRAVSDAKKQFQKYLI